MIIKCGVDLVYLPRFKKSLNRGGENFLRRIYHEQELIHLRGGLAWHTKVHLEGETSHLAGIFAAKEAVIKALDLPIDSWLNIKVVKNSKGTPTIELRTYNLQLTTSSLSISHDHNYVIAQFIAILKE